VVAGVEAKLVRVSDEDLMPNSIPYCSHFSLLIFSSPHIRDFIFFLSFVQVHEKKREITLELCPAKEVMMYVL
jgi:hypothetical protein